MKSSSLAGPLSLAVLLLMPLRLAGQTGDLRVVVATSGSKVDTNGYVVALDTLRQSVGVVGFVVFTVKPGIHTAILLDVAGDCIVPEGNPRKVIVRRVGVAELRFDVVCGESVPEPPAPQEPVEPPAPQEPVEPPAPQEPAEPPERRDVPQEPAEPLAPREPAEPPAPREPVEPPAPQDPVEPPTPQEPAEPLAPQDPVEPPTRRDEPQEVRLPTPGATPIGSFSVGRWVATIEPPGFPSYPVNMTFYSEQSLGDIVGSANYESPSWSCSYDLILEFAGNDNLVVAQQLTMGDCPEGIRVVLTRQGANLGAEWLRPDESPWFEAVFVRSQ